MSSSSTEPPRRRPRRASSPADRGSARPARRRARDRGRRRCVEPARRRRRPRSSPTAREVACDVLRARPHRPRRRRDRRAVYGRTPAGREQHPVRVVDERQRLQARATAGVNTRCGPGRSGRVREVGQRHRRAPTAPARSCTRAVSLTDRPAAISGIISAEREHARTRRPGTRTRWARRGRRAPCRRAGAPRPSPGRVCASGPDQLDQPVGGVRAEVVEQAVLLVQRHRVDRVGVHVAERRVRHDPHGVDQRRRRRARIARIISSPTAGSPVQANRTRHGRPAAQRLGEQSAGRAAA